MKKKLFVYILCFLAIFLIGASVLFDFNNQNDKVKNLSKVSLAEVAHTVFYAPMYVAYEKGFFEEEGIDLEIILANGADKVTASVLSGDCDIGFSGSEATIYVYNGGEKDYLKTFSQLTQKDGSFIVSREKIDSFKLTDLIGKNVIGGRVGGMPEMVFEYSLKQNGINPREDLFIDTSIAFSAMGGAFIGGEGDFVTLFEPTASMIEKEGYGYVVESVGSLGGVVPYTSFSAKKSYIENNPDIIKKFDKAIQRGLDFVHSHTDIEVAKAVLNQFPDTSLNILESAIKRYRDNDTWPINTNFSKESFDHLQDIMIDYGQIKDKVNYNDLFYEIEK